MCVSVKISQLFFIIKISSYWVTRGDLMLLNQTGQIGSEQITQPKKNFGSVQNSSFGFWQ